VVVGQGFLFDPFALAMKKGEILLGDAPHSQASPVVGYVQWNIDSNSNNGSRLPFNCFNGT
jgi:hypothetical protein